MERVLAGLEPKKFFEYFEDICRIPHESGNEAGIADYLVKFAEDHGLEVQRDAFNSVVITKPATPGYEDRKPIMLQGHTDMVCVKEDDVEIDFAKDPIPIYIDGDFVKARGTSLGADDGHAVAMILALLDNDELKHPLIQGVFSATEETTMAGAENIDGSWLKGEYLFGLDWSKDDTFLLSCCGSSEHCFTLPIGDREAVAGEGKVKIHLDLFGGEGGHSGKDIGRYRANGNKLMTSILAGLTEVADYGLVDFIGGNQTNVITEWAKADIICAGKDKEAILAYVKKMGEELTTEFMLTDPNLTMVVEEEALADEVKVLAEKDKEAFLNLMELLPNGVSSWIDQTIYLAKSSMNIGAVRFHEDTITIRTLVRSNSDHDHDELLRKLKTLAKVCGAEDAMSCKALAWDYVPDSELQREVKRVYKDLFGVEPGFTIAHGQTETGIFTAKMKEQGKPIQAVNIGVVTYDVHSFKERMSISSAEKTYKMLCAFLENIK